MPLPVLLLLGAGLLFYMPIISAQEETAEEALFPQEEALSLSEEAPPPAEDPLLTFEQSLTLEEGLPLPAGAAGGSSIWSVVRMVLTLALAAAAVYGVVFFIKKASRRNEAKDPFLKVLAGAHLGSNRYAHIVAVGSKAWLLGSSDGGVSLIGEIEDKDILNAMLLEESQKSAEAAPGRIIDFRSILRRFGVPADSRVAGAENIRKRRERLKGL